MIKDFLIINCTGKNNDSIGLKINNNFFIKEIQTNIKNNETIIADICKILSDNNVNFSENFSVIVNIGPGSFSKIRTSLSIAKGIKIAKKTKIYGFQDCKLKKFDLESIEFLIKNNLIENKLIKPVYLS